MVKAGDGEKRSSKRRATKQLYKRVTDAELKDFKRRAIEAGFEKHQDYLTALIAGQIAFDRRDRTDLIKILGELGKHGSNLNQIAYGINSGKLKELSEEDIKTIDEARSAVDEASRMLREALK